VVAAALPAADEIAAVHDALTACRTQLEAAGIDLNDYNTPAAVEDLDAIRRALGINQWNVLGRSYGTIVALEYIRQHHDAVRSVILDSVWPADVPLSIERKVHGARTVFDSILVACAANFSCHQQAPHLDQDLAALQADWNETPFEHDVVRPSAAPLRLVLTGDDIVNVLITQLMTQFTSNIPAFVSDLSRRSLTAATIVDKAVGSFAEDDKSDATYLSVGCADRSRLGAGQPTAAVAASDPLFTGLADELAQEYWCEGWPVKPNPPAFNEAVTSDVPALVLAGAFDANTPAADGERAVATLSRGQFVVFPGLGHAVTLKEIPCPDTIVKAFLAKPDGAVDTTCVDGMRPLGG
jgi:pimeloyl-ACP methyl ester carboxylesterase